MKLGKQAGNVKQLFRNELDKACLAHDAAYSDSKNLDLFQTKF